MGDKRIRIEVGAPSVGGRRFVEAWRAAESGEAPDEPVEVLVFEDLESLLRTLTPTRWRF